MNNFESLMLQEQTGTLTIEELEFLEVHKQIVSYGEMTGRYFVEMCQKVKQMRDGKVFEKSQFGAVENGGRLCGNRRGGCTWT